MLPRRTQLCLFHLTEATWTFFWSLSSAFPQIFHCHLLQLLQISWTWGSFAPFSETVGLFSCGALLCRIPYTGSCLLSTFRISFSLVISLLNSFWRVHEVEQGNFSSPGLVGVNVLLILQPIFCVGMVKIKIKEMLKNYYWYLFFKMLPIMQMSFKRDFIPVMVTPIAISRLFHWANKCCRCRTFNWKLGCEPPKSL